MSKNFVRLLTLTALGLAMASQAAFAQQASPPRWRPSVETITVSAMAAARNLRAVLTGTNISQAFAVSASIPVPYADLNLTRDPDADELNRRIGVAARLVCTEIDIKYPPSQYPVLGEDNCVEVATKDGLSAASQAIASKRR